MSRLVPLALAAVALAAGAALAALPAGDARAGLGAESGGRGQPRAQADAAPSARPPDREPTVPPGIASGDATASFERDFLPETLRIELTHSGDATAEHWALAGVGREGPWAGPRSSLLDPWSMGELRLSASDEDSGRVIFRRGFGSIFDEWCTTAEAKSGPARSLPETLRLPIPRRPAVITVERRDAGGWSALLEFNFDPAAPLRDWALALLDSTDEPLHIVESGPPSRSVDLLVIGDGYPASQREKFRRDAQRMTDALLDEPPFKTRRGRFNVTALRAPATEIGPAEPRKGRMPRQALTGFDTFGSPRYLLPGDLRRLEDLAGAVPHDALIVMVNSSRYGGGGIFRRMTVFTSDGEYPDYLLLHEFGHGFAGLADEYFSSSVAYEEFYATGVEPWEPNITGAADRVRLKWGRLVGPGVPLPTPDEERFDGVIGAFEGAGYVAKGLYRPARRCKMKDKGPVPYCAVCGAAIGQMIDLVTGATPRDHAR